MLSFRKPSRSRFELLMMWDAAVSLRTHTETGSLGMHAMVSSPWKVPARAVLNGCFSTYEQSAWQSGPTVGCNCSKPMRPALAALRFGRGFSFLLHSCPSCACCFRGKLFPLLWSESCHACLYALAFCCLAALSAHLTHNFGN